MAERGGFAPMPVFTDNIIQLHNSFLPLFFITRLSFPKIKRRCQNAAVLINGFICLLVFLYFSCVHSCLHSIQDFQPAVSHFSGSLYGERLCLLPHICKYFIIIINYIFQKNYYIQFVFSTHHSSRKSNPTLLHIFHYWLLYGRKVFFDILLYPIHSQ